MKTPKVNLSEVEAELCKRSFYEFVKSFWDEIIPDEMVDSWHIEYLCNELQTVGLRVIARKEKAYDLIINIPPGTSKSTICTIMFPAWLWCIDSTIKTISASYSDSLAISHSVKSRDILKSEKFQRLFPEKVKFKSDQDNKSEYQNTSGGARITTSVGGTITGKHGHIIILDDPLNPRQATSEVERENANEWLDKTISSRKVDKKVTPTILIMQRLHEKDCTGHILSKEDKKIKHICLPAELSENVRPEEVREKYVNGYLDPVRLDREVCEAAKTDLGSYGYAGQYGQRPAPLEGGIIKKHWFPVMSYEEFYEKIIPENPTFNIWCDPAYTKNQQNDPTGLLSGCRNGSILYLTDFEEKWLEFPDLIKYIPQFCEKNNIKNGSRVYIEPKASGLSIIQALKYGDLNVVQCEPPKDDKVTRANSITAALEAGKVVLVGSLQTKWVDKFLTYVCQFPNAAHDEAVDCLVMAVDKRAVLGEPMKPIIGQTRGGRRW